MATSAAEQARWDHATGLGITWPHLRNLADMMALDYRDDTWGFPQLQDLSQVEQRAAASDQIISAADAVLTNLIEARTAEADFQDRAKSGVTYLDDDIDDETRQDLAVIDFFRAFGSTLDCLAALVIGTVRLPVAIHGASMAHIIGGLDPAKASTPNQAALWSGYRQLLDRQRAGPPDGWLDWALQYRNALLHRPRQINLHLPRKRNTNLWLPQWVAQAQLRFDLYLRSRPWLPELQHLAEPNANVADLFLHEPATQTLRGLMEHLNGFVEATAEWLREPWIKLKTGGLALPSQVPRWGPVKEPTIGFGGFAPRAVVLPDTVVGNPRTVVRFALAQKLLDRAKK
jgi:hypothetical protein